MLNSTTLYSRPADVVSQFIELDTAIGRIPDKRLTTRLGILRMPQNIRLEHAANVLAVHIQREEFGQLAQAWSMDYDMTRLFSLSRHDIALALLKHDCAVRWGSTTTPWSPQSSNNYTLVPLIDPGMSSSDNDTPAPLAYTAWKPHRRGNPFGEPPTLGAASVSTSAWPPRKGQSPSTTVFDNYGQYVSGS